jgi:hypothetical protein
LLKYHPQAYSRGELRSFPFLPRVHFLTTAHPVASLDRRRGQFVLHECRTLEFGQSRYAARVELFYFQWPLIVPFFPCINLSMPEKTKHNYDESKIKTLSSLEHIRLRTGMYIRRIGNVARDALVTRTLRRSGWRVLRVWEHELARKNQARLLQRIQKALGSPKLAALLQPAVRGPHRPPTPRHFVRLRRQARRPQA